MRPPAPTTMTFSNFLVWEYFGNSLTHICMPSALASHGSHCPPTLCRYDGIWTGTFRVTKFKGHGSTLRSFELVVLASRVTFGVMRVLRSHFLSRAHNLSLRLVAFVKDHHFLKASSVLKVRGSTSLAKRTTEHRSCDNLRMYQAFKAHFS